MNQTRTTFKNPCLAASSIAVDPVAYNTVQVFHIFRPDEKTRALLESIKKGDILDGLSLEDKFDNGECDVHVNPSRFEVVTCFTGDSRKTESITLIVLDLDKVCRLPMTR